jgi:DNA-binding NtrC family response regulator
LFTPEVLEDMGRHDWPGNVRELRNYVERSVVLEQAAPTSERPSAYSIMPPPVLEEPRASAPPAVADLEKPFKVAKDEVISDFEQRYLSALLDWAGGNISKASRKAKMDRMYLYRLLQRYDLRGGSTIKD